MSNLETAKYAISFLRQGLSVLPIRADGSKAPALKKWDDLQRSLPAEARVKNWFKGDIPRGLGIVTGKVSGNLEVLDFDDSTLIKPWLALVAKENKDLLKHLIYIDTPSGGLHIYYRCKVIQGNQKLARKVVSLKPVKWKTMIETRGEGGYVLAPGSPGACHPTGNVYSFRGKELNELSEITEEQRQILLNCARALQPEKPQPQTTTGSESTPAPVNDSAFADLSPGDDYNNRADHTSLFSRHGWKLLKAVSGVEHWQRPGKKPEEGASATWDHAGLKKFHVFSTNAAPFEAEKTYNLFACYCLLEHGGDWNKAANALKKEGYGSKSEKAKQEWKPEQKARPKVVPAPYKSILEESSIDDPIAFDQIIEFDDQAALEVPILSPSFLPSPLQEFAESAAESIQVPICFSTMMCLATLATANQKRFKISPVDGLGYKEPLNLWICCALPKGNRKSELVRVYVQPLVQYEEEVKPGIEQEITKAEAHNTSIQEEIKNAKKNIKDRTEREEKIAELLNMLQPVKPLPQLFTNDTTAEALQNLLLEQGETMSILSDEGGIFEIMAGLYNKGNANIDVFLQSHAGTSVRVNRGGGRKVIMNNPALSFGISPQPEVISKLAKGNKEAFEEKGILARFLFGLPKSNIGFRSFRQLIDIDANAQRDYKECIHSLLEMDRSDNPPVLSLEPSALEDWMNFGQWVEDQLRPGAALEPIKGWASKLPGAVLRIAGNFHLAKNFRNPQGYQYVTRDSIQRACDLAERLIVHSQKAFGLMKDEPLIADAKRVLEFIKGNRAERYSSRELLKACFNNSPIDRLERALSVLYSRNIVSNKRIDMQSTSPNPPAFYYVNPQLFDKRS